MTKRCAKVFSGCHAALFSDLTCEEKKEELFVPRTNTRMKGEWTDSFRSEYVDITDGKGSGICRVDEVEPILRSMYGGRNLMKMSGTESR